MMTALNVHMVKEVVVKKHRHRVSQCDEFVVVEIKAINTEGHEVTINLFVENEEVWDV